jgi:hypothetical protein
LLVKFQAAYVVGASGYNPTNIETLPAITVIDIENGDLLSSKNLLYEIDWADYI